MDADRFAGLHASAVPVPAPEPAGMTGAPVNVPPVVAAVPAVPDQPGERAEPPVFTVVGAPRPDAESTAPGGTPQAARGEPAAEGHRVDVRSEPLAVREGCAPQRIPPGRWISDRALVRSEQFAVNEALAALRDSPGAFPVYAPSGTGVTEVFSDLVAAIVTERARRLADLPDPASALGQRLLLGTREVTALADPLAGFEIVLAGPDGGPAGLAAPGSSWRDRAADTDYFAATAWLAGNESGCALLLARLGDRQANQAFADRWWRGVVRGSDVLFPVGEPMPAALRRLRAQVRDVDWPTAVVRFRLALAKAEKLAAERMVVATALTKLSAIEQACEEASAAAETATAALEALTAREPEAAAAVAKAEEHRRSCLADLAEHEMGRPVAWTITESGRSALRHSWLTAAVAGGLRRGRNWREWNATRRALRAACSEATRQRDVAARAVEQLRASITTARSAQDRATAEVTRLTAEMGPLAETVGRARQRWGDFVPDGPSQAETEDAALIERRETSAPWADRVYSTARTEVFLAALTLHKALIAAQSEVFEANLAALVEWLTGPSATDEESIPRGEGAVPPGEESVRLAEAATADEAALLAAWRSFFFVIPVVSVPFGAAESLFAGLGERSLGWLLAETEGQGNYPAVRAARRLTDRAVLAGDVAAARDAALDGEAPRPDETSRYGTWLRAGPAAEGNTGTWVGTPLRVVRGQDRGVIDMRNDHTYDGLLIPDWD